MSLLKRCVWIGGGLLSGATRMVSARNKPNIVFILADDLSEQDVGFTGSHFFETLHLEALLEPSLVFDSAHMHATRSPSRAAILTGKQSFRTGCVAEDESGPVAAEFGIEILTAN